MSDRWKHWRLRRNCSKMVNIRMQIIEVINKEFVATEIFPRTIGRKISMLALIREQSDYNDFYIASSAESQQQVEIADELLKLVAEYLKRHGIEL